MEEYFWIFLCCCCCCCCILPIGVLVPLAIAGALPWQTEVVEVVNASTSTVWPSYWEEEATTSTLPASWRPFGPDVDTNSTLDVTDMEEEEECEHGEDVIEGENGTNFTRCKKSRKWIVRITYIEVAFNWMGEVSYYTSLAALICGASQVGLALLSAFCCPAVLAIPMLILETLVGSFFGLIYIGYLITIPLFGWPEDDGEGSNIFFPSLPHVGPPPPPRGEESQGFQGFLVKTVYAVRNSIFLALVFYMLMMAIMVFLGSLIVIPSVAFFMGILVGLTRLADSVVRMLAHDLDEEFKEEMQKAAMAESMEAKDANQVNRYNEINDKKEKAEMVGGNVVKVLNGESTVGEATIEIGQEVTGMTITDVEQGVKEMQNKAKGMLEQVEGCYTIPWWDNITKDYFKEMDPPSQKCVKMASCEVGLKDFCLSIFSLLSEFLESVVTVGLPSFVKFNFDILFLLTVLGSFSIVMPDVPAFKFDLPDVELGISALVPGFQLFDIKLPQLPPTYVPEWQGHCQATTGLGLILNLLGSTFTATVVISSDILSCLYDRQSRIKLLKAAQKQKDKAHDNHEENTQTEKKSCWQKIQDKISTLKTYTRPAKISFFTGLVEVSTFAVLFSIGLIVNQATVFLLRLIMEMGAPNVDDGKKPEGWAPCTVGVFGLSKILAVVAMFATLSYAYRVLSGHVHKDGIYILGGALVQEEKIFQLTSLKRLVAIVRVCSFALFLPFLSLGLQDRHMNAIRKDLDRRRGSLDAAVKKNPDGQLLDEDKVKEVEQAVVKKAARLTERKKGRGMDITAVKRTFAARSAMTSSLFDLALNERGQENEMLLERKEGHSDLRSVNDFHLFEFTECCKAMELKKRTTWYHPFLAMLGSPVGRMSNSDAIANRMAERCCIWQAQAESVHKASSYIHGIVLFLIPIGGTVAGKGLQVMSDSPGLFTAEADEICEYSFYQEPNLETGEPQILPNLWRRASYVLAVLRVICTILTISLRSTPVFWAMSSTNSFLAVSQSQLQKRADEENKAKIARIHSNPEQIPKRVKPQTVGSQDQDDLESHGSHDSEDWRGNRLRRRSGQQEEDGNPDGEEQAEDKAEDKAEDEVEEQGQDDHDDTLEEIQPQFDFQSDEEAPSPKPSKAKAKAKKSKVSKAKGKAKAKAKAKAEEPEAKAEEPDEAKAEEPADDMDF